AVSHADGLHGDAGRSARARLRDDGRRRPGDVPHAGADQRLRLRHGDPGGHRAAAVHVRPARSRRHPRHGAHREPGAPGRARRTHPQGASGAGRAGLVRTHGTRARHHRARGHASRWRRPSRRWRRDRILMARTALLLSLLLLAWPAAASEWGGVEPGVTTLDDVRARYGQPSKETRAKVENYDTVQWVCEGDRAPAGMNRMTVDFGLLVQSTYKPTVVRLLTLEPRPGIFGKQTVVSGWGVPDGLGDNPDGTVSMFWKDGLIVTLD